MRLLTILCLVLLSVHSYSQGFISEVETVTRDGLIYHQSSTEPFTGVIQGFYANGELEGRVTLVNGKTEGLWESFYEDGQLNNRANLVNGKAEGFLETYSSSLARSVFSDYKKCI